MQCLSSRTVTLPRGFVHGATWALGTTGGPMRATFAPDGRGAWGRPTTPTSATHLGRTASWVLIAEDLPEYDNRVDLRRRSSTTPGVPVPRLHYRLAESHATAPRLACRGRRGRRSSPPEAHDLDVLRHKANGRFMGTARMAWPRDLVVDPRHRARCPQPRRRRRQRLRHGRVGQPDEHHRCVRAACRRAPHRATARAPASVARPAVSATVGRVVAAAGRDLRPMPADLRGRACGAPTDQGVRSSPPPSTCRAPVRSGSPAICSTRCCGPGPTCCPACDTRSQPTTRARRREWCATSGRGVLPRHGLRALGYRPEPPTPVHAGTSRVLRRRAARPPGRPAGGNGRRGPMNASKVFDPSDPTTTSPHARDLPHPAGRPPCTPIRTGSSGRSSLRQRARCGARFRAVLEHRQDRDPHHEADAELARSSPARSAPSPRGAASTPRRVADLERDIRRWPTG